jgi:hypothetical protein
MNKTPLFYRDNLDRMDLNQMFFILNKAVQDTQHFLFEIEINRLNPTAKVMLKTLIIYYENNQLNWLAEKIGTITPLQNKLELTNYPKAISPFKEMNIFI